VRREIKIERARRLRKEDPAYWTYKRLGERYGVSTTTICEWLTGKVSAWKAAHPERVRELNLKRNAAKREWERNHRAKCPECGGEMGAGSASRKAPPARCKECQPFWEAERVHERAERIVEWWGGGLSLGEIAGRLGWSVSHLGQEFHRLRERGYDLPYRYQRSAPRFPEQAVA